MDDTNQATNERPTQRPIWRRSWRFWVVAIVAVFVFLSVAGFLALRPEMSRRAKVALTEQLQSATGGKVEVGDVDFYPGKIVANDVQFYEATDDSGTGPKEGGSGSDPFIKVKQIVVDFPILSTFDPGMKPSRLSFSGGEVHLQFDAAGNLLNKIQPAASEAESFELPIKRIRFQTIALRIEQEGRTTALLRNFNLKFLQGTEAIDFAGWTHAFEGWWQFDGSFDPNSKGDFDIHLHSERAETNAKELWALPFLPQVDESYVDFSGASKVDLRFSYSPDDLERAFRYRIALIPEAIDLAIPIGGVYFTKFRGGVLIEDDLITATGGQADWVDGRINFDGTFDYSTMPLIGDIDIRCEQATIAKFPRLWSLPEFVGGKLTAKGHLGLDVGMQATKLEANAIGVVNKLDVNGLVADESVIEILLEELSVPAEINQQNPVVAKGDLSLLPQFKQRSIDQLVTDFSKMIELPVPSAADDLRGTVNVSGDLILPLATIDDWTTYLCNWKTDSQRVSVKQLELQNILGEGILSNGVVKVGSLSAESNGGRLTSTATIDPNAEQLVRAKIEAKDCRLEKFARMFGADQAGVEGDLYADVSADVSQSGEWRVEGMLRSDDLVAQEISFTDVEAYISADAQTVLLKNGIAVHDDFKLNVKQASLPLNPEPKASGVRGFEATFRLSEIDLTKQLAKTTTLDNSLRIPAPLVMDGRIEQSKEPGAKWFDSLLISGSGQLPSAKWKDASVNDIKFNWDWANGELLIQDARARALNGTVSFETTVPLSNWLAIEDATIAFRDIDLSQVSSLLETQPSSLAGQASGELKLNDLNSNKTTADLQFRDTTLLANSLSFSNLSGSAAFREGAVNIDANGKFLDGAVGFVGNSSLADLQRGRMAGQMTVQKVDLRRLAAESPRFANLKPITGSMAGTFDFRFDDNDRLQGDGELKLDRVAWQETPIVESSLSKVSIKNSILKVRATDARFGQGTGSGSLTYDLQQRQPGKFDVSLSRVDLAKLSKSWEAFEGLEAGESDVRFSGKIGNSIEGRGRLNARRLKGYGVQADSIRSDFQFRYDPRSGSGRVEANSFAMKIAEGQVAGSLQYGWGSSPQLTLKAKLDRLNARRLVRSTSLTSSLQRGQVSGQLKLSGRNVREFKDLQGSFKGNLKQTDVLHLPVLEDVARVASTGRVANVPFDSDQLELTLSQGAVTVKQMSLNGDLAQLTVGGKIRPGQRLDLDVAVHVGRSQTDQQIARLLSFGAAASGGLPLTVLAEVNELLSERLVFLEVSGTINRPRVKLQADRQLGQEVALFFLNNSFGGKIPLGNLR